MVAQAGQASEVVLQPLGHRRLAAAYAEAGSVDDVCSSRSERDAAAGEVPSADDGEFVERRCGILTDD